MKKKLTAVTLLLATAFTAASCSSDKVTFKKVPDGDKAGQSIIFSINNGKEIEYFTAEDLLKELQDSATARTTLYNEISRQVFTTYADKTLGKDEISSIEKEAVDQVDEFKSNAKSSAKDEGTDYDKYLENALKGQGVSTLEELQDLYVYQGKKEAVLEDYVEDNYNYFLNKYLTAYTPFQVKHILVAANTSDTKYKDGTMTTDNARKLLNIVHRFLDGDTFATIADLTDDTSSKDNGGIMPFNEGQNYVSEFRFAPYMLEIFGKEGTDDEKYEKAAELHLLSNDVESVDYVTKEEFLESDIYNVYSGGIDTISLTEVMKLEGEVKQGMAGSYNYQYDEHGNQISSNPVTVAEQTYEMNVTKYDDEGNLNPKYYEEYQLERNKIFNKTLNTHKASYIELDGTYSSVTSNYATINGKKVLADENGNPIYVVLASTGIHLMCNVWNSYEKTIEENQTYFTLFDSNVENYKEKYANTYIGQNGAYVNRSTLQTNSDKLLKDITTYVSDLEYYLFNALVYDTSTELEPVENKIEISFYDETLAAKIEEHVTDTLKSSDETFANSVKTAVDAYGSKLAREEEVKESSDNWFL